MERLVVEALGNEVGGVSRPEGRPVTFIPGALPGETVLCELSDGRGSWREARLVEVVQPSSERVQPFCGLFGECGGCSLQHLAYEAQLHWKREWISNALRRGGIVTPPVDPVAASPDVRGYRNRVTFLLEGSFLHLHRRRGDPVRVSDCPLLHEAGRALVRSLDGEAGSGRGGLAVRASFLDGRTSLEFDGCTPPPLVKASGTEIWHRTDGLWEGSEPESSIRELMAGIPIRVPVGGFFQVNSRAASAMAQMVVESVMSTGAGRILDLYGGAGAFSIPLAVRGCSTVCVDSSRESLDAAGATAGELGIGESLFSQQGSDVESFLAEQQLSGPGGGFDAVIADPPRAGMGPAARLMAGLGTRTVIMVSCNPFTLARDLSYFRDSYDVLRISPFDLFPHTDHVETVCFLSRKPGKRG